MLILEEHIIFDINNPPRLDVGADVGEIAKTPTSRPRLAHVSKSDENRAYVSTTSRPRLAHVKIWRK